MAKTVFILAMIYFLMIDVQLKPNQWYSGEVPAISDWRGKPEVDYSTNMIVSKWYSGGSPKYLRQENIIELMGRADTITIGLDYYALFGISAPFLPFLFTEQFKTYRERLWDGEVIILKSYKGKIFIEGKL